MTKLWPRPRRGFSAARPYLLLTQSARSGGSAEGGRFASGSGHPPRGYRRLLFGCHAPPGVERRGGFDRIDGICRIDGIVFGCHVPERRGTARLFSTQRRRDAKSAERFLKPCSGRRGKDNQNSLRTLRLCASALRRRRAWRGTGNPKFSAFSANSA